jgi:hypothetical protein
VHILKKNGIGANKMKNIYFLWATIRPEMMYETYKHWMNTRTTNTNVILKVAVLTNEQKTVIDNYNIINCDVIVVDDKVGYAHAVTKLTTQLQANDDDILLLISDDFYSPKGWDEYLLNKFDYILLPTTPTTAFKFGEHSNDPVAMYLEDLYTVQASVSGVPALSIPIGKDEKDLPIGLQIMANSFKEAELYAFANYLTGIIR